MGVRIPPFAPSGDHMSYEIEQSSPCRVVLTATLPAERVGAEREHVVAEWIRGVRASTGSAPARRPATWSSAASPSEIKDDLHERLVHTLGRGAAEDTLRPAGPFEVREGGVSRRRQLRARRRVRRLPQGRRCPALDGFTAPAFELEPKADEVDRTSTSCASARRRGSRSTTRRSTRACWSRPRSTARSRPAAASRSTTSARCSGSAPARCSRRSRRPCAAIAWATR